ncbi:MAG: RNA methyltransferase [Gammaproteobacteria bacterium]
MILQSKYISVVLVETSLPRNIGSAARAMKNMGLTNLILVKPKNFPHGDARALAGNALDILESATVVDSLAEAIGQAKLVFATSARERSIGWPSLYAADAAKEIVELANAEQQIAIIFGREDRGLTNEELQLANKHLVIPADDEYPVLNISQSVQIICYEIFKNSNQSILKSWQDYPSYTQDQLQRLVEHFNNTAVDLGVVDPENPKQILTRMERMFRRLYPDQMEGNFLRGFLDKVDKLIKKS